MLEKNHSEFETIDVPIDAGNARFTILSSRLLRLEWSASETFEDRSTLVVKEREVSPTHARITRREERLVIETEHLTLTYISNGEPFNQKNLTVQIQDNEAEWHPGKADPSNLKGTIRTLDSTRCPDVKLPDGIISRSGWFHYDDSKTPVRTEPATKDGGKWVSPPEGGDRLDWYFLGYGLDFKAGLREATRIFGKQPLPPRYVLGYWWSRYWTYTDQEVEGLLDAFDHKDIPIDVMVIDMDWHLEGWTGYTWDKRLFPDPELFLKDLKERGIKVTLNLHPADGVDPKETAFGDMSLELGRDPENKETIPFDCTDAGFMSAYFKHLHHPHEDMGVDFWWMDWQQGTDSEVENLDPLTWLNILHWEDRERRFPDERPLIFSRFGGLGSGRYPIGFSGDTFIRWDTLEFIPYFTATAANVLYGYWSHDVGGHMFGEVPPEMYTRWLQLGCYLPILRTHTSKHDEAERRFWQFPEPFTDIMQERLRYRYELVPYIYTENHANEETGLSLCRPMYHEHPQTDAAYHQPQQFYFGSSIIVAPITLPRHRLTSDARQSVWLPGGDWFDEAYGDLLKGEQTLSRAYLIDETPVFHRAGSIMPGQFGCRRLNHSSYRNLVITAYPGGNGSYTLYEDDGYTVAYRNGSCARTRMDQEVMQNDRCITLHPMEGEYEGAATDRQVEFRFPTTLPPQNITVDGVPLGFSHHRKPGHWWYEAATATLHALVHHSDVRKPLQLRFQSSPDTSSIQGLPAKLRRLSVILDSLKLGSGHGYPEVRRLLEIQQTARRINLNPHTIEKELTGLTAARQELPSLIRSLARESTLRDADYGIEMEATIDQLKYFWPDE